MRTKSIKVDDQRQAEFLYERYIYVTVDDDISGTVSKPVDHRLGE